MAKRAELKVVTPGEEPQPASGDTSQPKAAVVGEDEAAESAAASPDPNSLDAAELKPKAAATVDPLTALVNGITRPRSGPPDQSEVDPSTIPYGKTVFTKQGHVCSTAPDPKRK